MLQVCQLPTALGKNVSLTRYPESVTEAGPSAFANIGENYYYVFVACTSFFLVIAYFFFPYVTRAIQFDRNNAYPISTVKPSKRPSKKWQQHLATASSIKMTAPSVQPV
jgi:hypothetical protein